MDDWRLRVCLERTVELATPQLRLRDWPGFAGPIVHVPDPFDLDDSVAEALAEKLAPRYRVLSLTPRGSSPYQVDAADLRETLDQFGFEAPILLGEGLGCVAALLVAAWHPNRLLAVVLFAPTYEPPEPPISAGLAARALRDCPPDWASLRQAIECPVLVVPRGPSAVDQIARFLAQLAPVVT